MCQLGEPGKLTCFVMPDVGDKAGQLAKSKGRENWLAAHEEPCHVELLKHELRQSLLICLHGSA